MPDEALGVLEGLDMQLDQYPQKFLGAFGEMGHGGNVSIKFLQTGMRPSDLNKVDLIRSIHKSEEWSVRDLFQRDVDQKRVTEEILPWLRDRDDEWKYFSPLTLVMLPLTQGQVVGDLRTAENTQDGDKNHSEVDGLFKFSSYINVPNYASVEFNPSKIKLVALDGQHRLSALKRWLNDGERAEELEGWTIPTVILGIVKDQEEVPMTTDFLEVVRKTFVYINSKGEPVSDARSILLDDASINKTCVQEVVQASHENDVKRLEDRDPDILPLLFFDWRDEKVPTGADNPQPSALLKTTELLSWMEEYLLGTDGKGDQKRNLQLGDMRPPLGEMTPAGRLPSSDTTRIREQFRKTVYPGVRYLLENLKPYKEYIEELRRLETNYTGHTDLHRHAWARLRFGHDNALPGDQEKVTGYYIIASMALGQATARIPGLLQRDIGMRGIVSAFSHLKKLRDEHTHRTIDWKEFAEWFVPGMDKVIDHGWFKEWPEIQDPSQAHSKRFLTHVAFEPYGSIKNMKHGPVKNAIGTLLALLVLKELAETPNELELGWGALSGNLSTPVKAGYKKVFKEKFSHERLSEGEKNARVKIHTDEAAEEYLKDLKRYLG